VVAVTTSVIAGLWI